MTAVGQLALLVAFVACGYAGFACTVGWRRQHPGLTRSGSWAAAIGAVALSVVVGVLVWALLAKDFRFAYVAQYSRRSLPWYYSLSAMWVGQAGSLALWAWMVALAAMASLLGRSGVPDDVRRGAFAILMLYLAFLVGVMVFGADPTAASLAPPADGAGLGPLLQHPAMLAHPPAVFLGYALWAVPFALTVASLISGRLDSSWIRQARPWALLAWSAQGMGILLGAEWAYEELGWGGYWAWDPVENGSLLPWLTGTAMIHAALAWQHRGVLKKTTLLLTALTFGLCNFAAFLTRSGIFGGVHEFSRSPIGWMFLALLVLLAAGAGLGVYWRRDRLAPDRPMAALTSDSRLV
ncbi:MAG: cytochrome c biogenesis protein CcsA, partial [Thermoguttaceae bacterium]|nr:cytochrome c biogenesis protein CcsA [Thermoguttaceae bacterium]